MGLADIGMSKASMPLMPAHYAVEGIIDVTPWWGHHMSQQRSRHHTPLHQRGTDQLRIRMDCITYQDCDSMPYHGVKA
jgi:hypothetical protein